MNHFTNDINEMGNIYDSMNKSKNRVLMLRDRIKKQHIIQEKTETHTTDFPITKINIQTVRGIGGMPTPMYNAKVVKYVKESSGNVRMTAIDNEKRKKIRLNVNVEGNVDVHIFDKNDIPDTDFSNGMIVKDIDDPKKITIIKVEQPEQAG